MTEKIKAKRKLTKFNFQGDDSAIALVGPAVGGAANGKTVLLTKSLTKRSPEFIQKAQEIQVTLSVPDFLEKFFGVWGSDNAVLSSLLGYVAPEKEDDDWSYDTYIQERINSFKIIKSLHESDDITKTLASLTDEEYLSLLTDQVVIEKALEEFAKEAPKAPEVDTSTKVEKLVEAPASKVNKNKGKSMDEVELQKALDAKEVALQKALDTVAKFEEAQKVAVIKAKTDKVQAVLKDEKAQVAVLKAVMALESDEDIDALVQVVKSLVEAAEKSAAFEEIGASGDAAEVVEESKLAKVIKARNAEALAKQKQ